jgi:hypothetical protein
MREKEIRHKFFELENAYDNLHKIVKFQQNLIDNLKNIETHNSQRIYSRVEALEKQLSVKEKSSKFKVRQWVRYKGNNRPYQIEAIDTDFPIPLYQLDVCDMDVPIGSSVLWFQESSLEAYIPKDGDYITIRARYGILIGILKGELVYGDSGFHVYAGLAIDKQLIINIKFGYWESDTVTPSTPEQIKSLDEALLKVNREWNPNLKKIVHLSKFKKGQWIRNIQSNKIGQVQDIEGDFLTFKTDGNCSHHLISSFKEYIPENGEFIAISTTKNEWLSICKSYGQDYLWQYCGVIMKQDYFSDSLGNFLLEDIVEVRPQTPEETQSFHKYLKAKGKQWDDVQKQLIPIREYKEYKDGDFIVQEFLMGANKVKLIAIIKGDGIQAERDKATYCFLNAVNEFIVGATFGYYPKGSPCKIREATWEEQNELLKAINANDYSWDRNKTQLVSLPKYKAPIVGEMAIFWDITTKRAFCAILEAYNEGSYRTRNGIGYKNAILFESVEQYKKFKEE